MRFSLRWLFTAILVVALSIAALLNANRTWSAIAHSTLVMMLAIAIVGGIYSRDGARAFAFGMAIVGWIYYGAVMLNPSWNVGDVVRKAVYDLIATEETTVEETAPDGSAVAVITRTRPDGAEFDLVIKCLVTGLVALSGGFAATWFQSRCERSAKI